MQLTKRTLKNVVNGTCLAKHAGTCPADLLPLTEADETTMYAAVSLKEVGPWDEALRLTTWAYRNLARRPTSGTAFSTVMSFSPSSPFRTSKIVRDGKYLAMLAAYPLYENGPLAKTTFHTDVKTEPAVVQRLKNFNSLFEKLAKNTALGTAIQGEPSAVNYLKKLRTVCSEELAKPRDHNLFTTYLVAPPGGPPLDPATALTAGESFRIQGNLEDFNGLTKPFSTARLWFNALRSKTESAPHTQFIFVRTGFFNSQSLYSVFADRQTPDSSAWKNRGVKDTPVVTITELDQMLPDPAKWPPFTVFVDSKEVK